MVASPLEVPTWRIHVCNSQMSASPAERILGAPGQHSQPKIHLAVSLSCRIAHTRFLHEFLKLIHRHQRALVVDQTNLQLLLVHGPVRFPW